MGIQVSPERAVPDLFITNELESRARARSDHRRETLALHHLAERMARAPEDVLPSFVDLALRLTGGDAAGISVLDPTASPAVFRWTHLRGRLAVFEGAATPRDFSPCGVTLDRHDATLCRHPERVYGWIADAGITAPEVLLVPLYRGDGDALGTLWILSDAAGHFDGEHARALSELATFVGIALKMAQTEAALKRVVEEQQTIAREMSHRVKNVFAMTDSMIRMTVRGASTKEEFANSLSGRIQALARSHALVRRDFATEAVEIEDADLATLIATVVRPHEETRDGRSRFSLDGPALRCGSHMANNVAMIFHELATNAAKYGALVHADGQVAVRWETEGDMLRIRWSERGGPAVTEPTGREGFGSSLVRRTIAQLGGTLERDWAAEGLVVRIALPVASLGV